MNESIEAARFLRRKVFGYVEAFDLARYLRGKRRRIEAGDAGDAGFAGEDVGPGFRETDADGRNDAETSDDYSAPCQICTVRESLVRISRAI